MQSETKKQSIMGIWSRSAAAACLALILCSFTSSAFATNSWITSAGSWGTPSGWSSGVVPADTEQIKILGGNTCTLDVDAGTFTAYKVTVGTSGTMAYLNIVDGGSITSVLEIQDGDASGKTGTIAQTGGTVNLNGTSSKDSKLEVGYKGGPGFYTLSGGSIVGNDYSRLCVGPTGSVNGGVGTFTMQGTGGSISVAILLVGVQDSAGSYTGTGTLAFEINGGVSAINAVDVYIDPCNQVAAVANLSVTKTGALPIGDIILINNTGPNSVQGAFDNAAWGSTVTVDGVNYTLTNTYIGGLDGLANDVALTIDTFTLTYTADANGSITGTTTQTVNYGTDGTAVTAHPYYGYHFVRWSDDSTENPRTDLNVTADITVQAIFEIGIETFTLTYTAGANGSITGTTPQTVEYGTDGTAVTAQPDYGYHFVKWSDDSTQNPRTDINVMSNITVQASFAIGTLTLTYTAGANGSIIGTSPQIVSYSTNGTAVTAQPDFGYHFVKWSDDSTQNPRIDLNVTDDITVQAIFAIGIYAFPGAEGSGCWATGGRGGNVYEVTNLNNAGAGSIVDALSQSNRTIVFRVSGTIELDGVILEPKSNTTIAGQTAPGDGICIKGRIHIKNGVHDIIIRYLRIRVDEGAANSSGDAIDIDDGENIIIDHVSASYARDESISCQENSDYVTVQWCIMSESLTFESHSYGSLIRGEYGQQKTYHHNLYTHNNNRNPRPGNYTATSSDPEGLYFDFRNNVVYNWAGGYPGYNADTSSTSRYNFVGNVFIQGVESSGSVAFKEDSIDSYAYWSGNAYGASYGTITVPSNQWSLVTFNGFSSAQIDAYKGRSYLIPMEAVTTTSASQALSDVLTYAGASFPSRDSVDTRIVNDVIDGTGSSIVNTSSSSWPDLNSLTAPDDADHDGMPDTWETAHGLNPDDAADRNNYDLNVNYTNLEVYLYQLVTFTLTYTAGANGSIIGTTPQTVNYGTDGTAVTAQPDSGYHFVRWTDGSTQNPRTDLNVTANITVQAIFATGTFTLTYTAGANGSITGTTPQTIDSGTHGTEVTAQPDTDYHFVRWTDGSTQNPRIDSNVMADITVRAIFSPDITMTVRKCSVAAGKTQYTGDSDFNDMKDSFTASGTMSAVPGDLNTIDHINVNIVSADGNVIFFESVDFNCAIDVKKNNFKHKYKIGKYNPTQGAITSLTIDFRKKTFAVKISSADLTGLACPLQLIFSLGDFVVGGEVSETIVNGNKKLIPTRLMRLYDDTLVVTKASVKQSRKKWLNSLSVKGDIAVADMNLVSNEPNLCNEAVTLTWGDGDANTQTFVIPARSFTVSKKGHTYKCAIQAAADDTNVGIVIIIATFDLDKCTFTATVRGATGLFYHKGSAGVFSVTFDTEQGAFREEDDYTLR